MEFFGSKRFKLALSDLSNALTVALWVAGSAFVTEMLQYLANYDFGNYQVVAMGLVNVLGVVAKKFFSDTRETVEVVPAEAVEPKDPV